MILLTWAWLSGLRDVLRKVGGWTAHEISHGGPWHPRLSAQWPCYTPAFVVYPPHVCGGGNEVIRGATWSDPAF